MYFISGGIANALIKEFINSHRLLSLISLYPVVFEKRIGPDAHVRAPDAPGMGHDVDLKTLEKVAVARI